MSNKDMEKAKEIISLLVKTGGGDGFWVDDVSCLKELLKMLDGKDLIGELEKYFNKLRFDNNHHEGLGDIRITVAQQEEILNMVKQAVGKGVSR